MDPNTRERLEQLFKDYTTVDGDHIIWTRTMNIYKHNKGSNVRINRKDHEPHMWNFLLKNNITSIPAKHYLVKTCNYDGPCIQHWSMVQNIGNIQPKDLDQPTKDKILKNLLKKSEQNNDCTLWTGQKNNAGYGRTRYGKSIFVHVLAFELYNSIHPQQGQVVRHMCNNRSCFAKDHLTLGTHKQNMQDKKLHGTDSTGSRHPNATITEDIAKQIFESKSKNTTQQQRSIKFGVPKSIVRDIDCGNTLTHVTVLERKEQKRKKRKLDETNYENAMDYIERKIEKKDNHWLWTDKISVDGYGVANFGYVIYRAHRLSWMAKNKQSIPDSLVVRHKCEYRHCVNPEHLEIGTYVQNMEDKIRDGTLLFGENHPTSIITEEIARSIKRSKGNGTQLQRAQQFNTTVAVIGNIDRGKTWKHTQIESDDEDE